MSVNGVTSTQAAAAYSYHSTSAAKEKTSAEEAKTTTTAEDTGVIYEHSTAAKTSSTKKTYTPDTNLVNKLKADAENRASQLRSLVEQMMGKQANTYGNANDIWSFLRSGNFTVNPATKAQAQADIAEDGYWGVNQTSDRIIQFANALTGGDPDKIESMREAFKKGYAQAEKTWGGSLPEISQKTYDAVMEKFDKLAADAGLTTEEKCRILDRLSYRKTMLYRCHRTHPCTTWFFFSELYQARPFTSSTFCPGRNSSLSSAFNSLTVFTGI